MEQTLRQKILPQLTQALNSISQKSIQATLDLLEEGNTIPFIARYRKEMTGSLDEVQIREIDKLTNQFIKLEERRNTIIESIKKQEKLTSALEREIMSAKTLQEVEDIYAPYKPKRETRASLARAMGLEGLAKYLLSLPTQGSIGVEAEKYVNNEVENIETALSGAREIMIEDISERADVRSSMRKYLERIGYIEVKKKKNAEDSKGIFETYYDFKAPINKLKGYQILAIQRGIKQGVLSSKVLAAETTYISALTQLFNARPSIANKFIEDVLKETYTRFILPHGSTEIWKNKLALAEAEAIQTFSTNLYHLLMQRPIKGKIVMGLDPAYRTGCKLAIVDSTGKLLAIDRIYITQSEQAKKEAGLRLVKLIKKYAVDMISIGNGTASRETEAFVAETIKAQRLNLPFAIVSESGASVYSASDLGRGEFPNLQVEERSAVSIARRVQDPLAELIKIDPQAIGVGQYQHDVSQKALADELSFTVERVVNQVGVDVNTASVPLLKRVAGLNESRAKNIIALRENLGSFKNRKQLKDVKGLGAKSFEQAAGFLRIYGGDELLDETPIHPEIYKETKRLLDDQGILISKIKKKEIREKIIAWSIKDLSEQYAIGEETLEDIQAALLSPRLDPRDKYTGPLLKKEVLTIEDLVVGEKYQGVVRNVTAFGAFVDIGVKEDGLIHISHMSKQYIQDPKTLLQVGDIVDVYLLEVDLNRKRISLSLIRLGQA